ncbi:uncharacterized protein LOC143564985 [Bidens hawaiensis]|uniref:uncharacterized protein LOC143564985 n=1 Tax=Bidens hawaiensis TaxID=980011 RepID=UPI0040492447
MPKPPFVLHRSLDERPRHPTCRARSMGEVMGGTTAEVTAVCCCFPCAAFDFTVLTVYKVPAGICRNAMWRRRRRLMGHREGKERKMDEELAMHPAVAAAAAAERFMVPEVDKDMLALEEEMWEKFSENGFWRKD